MSLIVRPNSYTAGTFAVASEVNADFNVIYTAFNGNVGEANMTYVTANDGVRVWRAGPNAGGTNGFRFTVVSQSVTMNNAVASGTQVVTFSTAAVFGNPVFAAAPTVFGISIQSATPAPDPDIPIVWVRPADITATQLTLQWDRTWQSGGPPLNSQSITVTVGLMGTV